MTQRFNTNLSPTNGSDVLYQWKQFMKTYGWTVVGSGDGLSAYSASADILTSSSAGANGTGQIKAWFTLQDPAGTRQFNVQVASNTTGVRIKFSRSAKFTGGSPSSTQVPSATDEQVLYGGGTDSAPTNGGANFFTTAGTYKASMMADDASPYGFWLLCYANSTGAPASCWLHDPMVSGTYPAEDAEPYVHYVCGASNTGILAWANASNGLIAQSTLGPRAWYKAGLTGSGFVGLSAMGLYSYNSSLAAVVAVPGAIGTNPHNGNDELIPVFWGRDNSWTAPYGWKGMSSLCRWRGVTRANASTLSVSSGTKNYFVLGDFIFNWDGSTPSL